MEEENKNLNETNEVEQKNTKGPLNKISNKIGKRNLILILLAFLIIIIGSILLVFYKNKEVFKNSDSDNYEYSEDVKNEKKSVKDNNIDKDLVEPDDNKDNEEKNTNNDDIKKKNLEYTNKAFEMLKNTTMIENISKGSIVVSDTDTPYDLINNKRNLYGVKLSNSGEFYPFCGTKNEKLDYNFTISDSNTLLFNYKIKSRNEKPSIFEFKPSSTSESNDILGIYHLVGGGCNSYFPLIMVEQYKDNIIVHGRVSTSVTTSHDYKMFYVIGFDVSEHCDECSEAIANYLIGETSNGDMYIITYDSTKEEIKVDKSLVFEQDKETKVYGATIKAGNKVINSFN